jgi:tetratricopeptide (TPR) repeat protein
LYLLDLEMRFTAPRYLVALGLVVAATMAAIGMRRRWPWMLAAWSLYVVVVSPVLGLAQTGPQLVADRYTYLACLPWAVLVAAAVARLATRYGGRRVLAIAALAVAILGTSTFRQTRIWHDSLRLWNHVLRLDPRSYVAYTNRAFVRADPTAAIADYTEAIRLNPRYHPAYFNRGELRHARGDIAGAVADYTAVIRLRPRDARADNNRGWARHALGDWEGAAADYARALELADLGWEHRALVEGNLRRARRRLASPAQGPRTGGAVRGGEHDVDGTRHHPAPGRQ